MKNTKKLLIAFCAAVVLFATVFSIAIAAVTAGENTPISEYASMKISASHGFEDGTTKLFSNGTLPNDCKNPGNARVYTQNNGLRTAAIPIYGDEQSVKYFIIDYDTNTGAKHWYLQPKLGVLDSPEKTPANGFVAEFDIAFLTPVEIVQEQAKDEYGDLVWEMEEMTDAEGNPVSVPKQATDEDGNPLWEKNEDGTDKLDENGEKIPQKIPVMQDAKEPLYTDVIKTDEDGNIVYKVKEYVQDTDPTSPDGLKWEYDSDGNKLAVMIPIYELDENGEKIPEYVEMIDENGEIIMTDKVIAKEWNGLSNSFEIAMYNTHTYADGSINLLKFATNNDEPGTMKLDTIKNNKVTQPDVIIKADEWCHIAIQYDAKTLFTYIYIGRDDSEFDSDGDGIIDTYGRLLVGKVRATATLESTGETVNVYPLQFRMGSISTRGVVGVDNLIGYQGTTIHDPTLLNNKLPYEKYLYLADVLADMHEYETVKDAEGNVVYRTLKDENGNPLTVQVKDENGNLLWETEGTDESGAPIYKLDENGEKIPVLENVYLLDTLGNKVPEYVLDANGNKKVIRKGANAVDRYQSFNLLATDTELRKVYNGESFGGDPSAEEMEALELAIKLYDAYAADKKDNTESTDSLVSCYYEMLNEARLENAATYLSYALDAESTERTLENYDDRTDKIVKAKEFYDSVGSLIERDNNGDYGKAVKILERLEVIVNYDEAANKFVSAMKIFNSSVAYGATSARIKRHYDDAAYYYNMFAGKEDYDYDREDTTLDVKSVEALKENVDKFEASAAVVSGNTKAFNSARFVGLVDLMQKKSTGVWSQDGEDVEELWLRALEIILDENYDGSLEEFKVAKIMFDSANNFFWDKMQKEHLKVITDKLDSYNDSDMTYIDKAGICTYVDRYIQSNERYLDLDSIEITREIARNEAYKLQLNTLVGDYKKLLVENAPRFISVMKMSKHYSTYADLKPLYDEATKYYYSMNIEGEGIEECLEDYEELRTLITSIERDSQAYIDVINGNVVDEDGNAIYKPMSEITNKQELYASLKEAYLCFENLDITYPGAAEAKAIYDAKYQEYNDGAAKVNTELKNAETVVYAARGNWSFDTVVIFVKKLINTKG